MHPGQYTNQLSTFSEKNKYFLFVNVDYSQINLTTDSLGDWCMVSENHCSYYIKTRLTNHYSEPNIALNNRKIIHFERNVKMPYNMYPCVKCVL